jgi:hypothetical protein
MKLGTYMPEDVPLQAEVASVIEWLHMTIASGADVISRFIVE